MILLLCSGLSNKLSVEWLVSNQRVFRTSCTFGVQTYQTVCSISNDPYVCFRMLARCLGSETSSSMWGSLCLLIFPSVAVLLSSFICGQEICELQMFLCAVTLLIFCDVLLMMEDIQLSEYRLLCFGGSYERARMMQHLCGLPCAITFKQQTRPTY